jgi:glycosyltransferase involved in cell wall biosynthesis
VPAGAGRPRPGRSYRLLSVIVPVFNEHNTVAEILRRIRSVELPVDLEVIVVDDGSTDGTDQVLSLLEDSTVRVVRHPDNEGKAAAVRTGLAHARGQLVLIQDADLEYDPADWSRLLDPVLKGKARVVYGSRFRGERMTMPLQRWVSNRLLAMATSVIYNRTVSDVETCYKLFDRSVLDRLRITSERFEIEAELTAKVLRLGYGIYEVPISFAGRAVAEGKKFTGRDSVRSLRALVRYRFSPPDG